MISGFFLSFVLVYISWGYISPISSKTILAVFKFSHRFLPRRYHDRMLSLALKFLAKKEHDLIVQHQVSFCPVLTGGLRQVALDLLYNGREHNVARRFRLPFSRIAAARMSGFKVELVSGEATEDITHEPGVPYLASPAALGGERIIVTSIDSGESVSFSEDQVPGFVEELE